MSILSTDRLKLCPVEASDFDDLARLWSSEELTRHIIGRPLTREEVWFRLLRDIGHWSVLGHGSWNLKLHNGTLIGSVGLFDYQRDLEPAFSDVEVGWAVDPAYQGQGLAREALQAALEHADKKLSLSRTVCMISADNTPSIKLAQKVGFSFYTEGHYKGAMVNLYERMRPGPDVSG